ncbi:MAG: CvpA family protein [Pseudomonadota bacterium]
MELTTVDIIVLGIIALSCLFGGIRGLVKEALSLGFWIAAVVFASVFNEPVADTMTGLIDTPSVRIIAAFVLIFVVTVFVGALISNLISKATAAVGLGAVDRGLGAIFGIIRGVVIVTVIVMLTAQLDVIKDFYSESIIVPYLMIVAEHLREFFDLSMAAATTVSA